ncbi:MAG TPA: ATP-binding protein [Steroidobacteraceae bacterium]|jgi:PAS domain S-box-containing protein|nr:ATP-binding protein [Steroidobacteraceae bacterium]
MPPTSGIRFRRLQLGVAVFGALVIIAFAGSSAFDAWRSYHYALVATGREIDNIAKALAEQTAWTLQTVDLMLLDTTRWYEGDASRLPATNVDAALAARTAGVKPVRQVTIVGADGEQLYRAVDIPSPRINVADRSYFVAHRDNSAAGLFISEPLVTRSDNHVAVVLSRRLEDSSHHFAGVVTARVDLDDVSQLYRAINIDAATAITLLQQDGTLLVRRPAGDGTVGSRFPALTSIPPGPSPHLLNPLDGRDDFISVAPVRDTDLVIAVTRDAQTALNPWREETTRVAIRTLVLLLLGSLTVAELVRQLGRVGAGERALRESEERYALAMEGANEGHWDWHIPSDRLFLSPQMKVLGGLTVDTEIASRNAWRQQIDIHPDDRALFERTMREHFEGRTQRFECEYRVRHPHGHWHWLLARGRCLHDPAGKPLRFVGSAIDITGQKQSLSEQIRLESQLRQSQKMEAIGTLAGGIAHDFNNILGAILGYTELAAQQAAGDSKLTRYLENVMLATERARKLVQRILGFSRSGLGNRIQFNAQAVVAETLELLEASLPVGIQLQRQLQAGDAAVTGDPTDLHQVTMNLCTNAVQAMDQGGTLGVQLTRSELTAKRELARGSLDPGAYLLLAVTDTGSGIPSQIQERIFDPFFTTKGVGQGTGLGLSLVHGIVNDLGGAIDVVSAPGQGTRFDIWLPTQGEVNAPAPATSQAPPSGNGEVILIVDDEPALVALAEEATARLGYEPVGFGTSLAALRAFEDAPDRFDVVISDESMPDLHGTELIRRLRRLRHDIPVILMTGHGSAELSQRVTELGVQEILLKPLQSRDLGEALARALTKVTA